MPHHLRPSTDYAENALLPGDPGRALALAQQLLTEPRMSNHARGLWGYTGETPEGRPLSIQSTGIGGPSAVIVLHELAELGVRRAIRVATCGSLGREHRHGDLIVVGEAIADDGTSRALGTDQAVEADAELTARLAAGVGQGATPSRVVTTDLFYDGTPNAAGPPGPRVNDWRKRGAIAVEMEAAALITAGRRLGVATACVLAVSDTFEGGRRQRMEDEALTAAATRMGSIAASALGPQP
jgi:uridine phosphorylase